VPIDLDRCTMGRFLRTSKPWKGKDTDDGDAAGWLFCFPR
jgi:hypothetical protein